MKFKPKNRCMRVSDLLRDAVGTYFSYFELVQYCVPMLIIIGGLNYWISRVHYNFYKGFVVEHWYNAYGVWAITGIQWLLVLYLFVLGFLGYLRLMGEGDKKLDASLYKAALCRYAPVLIAFLGWLVLLFVAIFCGLMILKGVALLPSLSLRSYVSWLLWYGLVAAGIYLFMMRLEFGLIKAAILIDRCKITEVIPTVWRLTAGNGFYVFIVHLFSEIIALALITGLSMALASIWSVGSYFSNLSNVTLTSLTSVSRFFTDFAMPIFSYGLGLSVICGRIFLYDTLKTAQSNAD